MLRRYVELGAGGSYPLGASVAEFSTVGKNFSGTSTVIIGQVMVDKVEDANNSIVNIIPGSVQPGQSIKPGDTLITLPVY